MEKTVNNVEVIGIKKITGVDDTGTIHTKDGVQILQTDIMQNLVICSLQEGRIDRKNRLDSACRHTC